ncbi:MAG: VOC family protein [Streptosporangiales bacterium]|nr:VOC family protein [Streptosporangiales bacterium]
MTEPLLDHLVYAAPDVDVLVDSFRERTGVDPPLGGRHVGRNTRNYLVGLGGSAYLELIGPDDPAEKDGTTVFGISTLTAPRIVGWVVAPEDIEARAASARARGYDPGEIGPLSRRTPDGVLLEWRLTKDAPDDRQGLVPRLIDWQQAAHPTTSGLPELALVSLAGFHPEPDVVRRDLDALGVELDVRPGDPGFAAVVETPNGQVTLT